MTSNQAQGPAAGAGTRSAPRVALLGEVSHRPGNVSVGGTGAGLIRLAGALTAQGWPVDLVTASAGRLQSYGETPPRAVATHALGDTGRPLQSARLLRYLIRHRPAVMVARDSRAIDLALRVKRISPVPFSLVCALHSFANLRPEGSASAEARKRRRFRRIGEHADCLLTVSPGMLEAAKGRLGERCRRYAMIPNPAYQPERVARARQRPAARPGSGSHIVFVGRLARQKDLPTLLRAFAGVLQDRPDAWLTLLGEGPERAALEALAAGLGIAGRTRFLGFVPEPLAHLMAADVFALASEHEAFGYVLVEALAAGVPVVSTDCPHGPAYILAGGEYGRLVPVGDADAMAQAIAATLDDPPDPRKLVQRARDFDADTVAAQYGRLFLELLDGNPGRTGSGGERNDAAHP